MKVSIRPWTPDDAPQLAEIMNNPNVLNNLRDGIPYPYTEQDAADFIAAMRGADPDQTFAFAVTAGGAVCGSISIRRGANVHCCTAELGYCLAEPYWGRGIMTEAVRLTCAHVFARTDLLRIFAEPFAYNRASCRVLEKAGFQLEGTLRSNAVKNGVVLDMQLYALVRAL